MKIRTCAAQSTRRGGRVPRRGFVTTSIAVTVTLAIGLLAPVQTATAASGSVDGFPDAPTSARVDGSLAKGVAGEVTPKSDKTVVPEPITPLKRMLTLEDDADADAVEVGDTGITAEAVGPAAEATTSDTNVYVEVLDETKRKALGDVEFALEITPGPTELDEIAVTIPDELMVGLSGADHASRIRWEVVPSAERQSAATAAEPAEVSRDGEVSTLKVSASEPMVVMATSAFVSSDGTGSYAVTPLKPSSSGNESAQTGAFAWSYPIPASPAPAGDTPQFALDYNSQLVDGETASTNNQPSAIGEGWTLSGTGYIERRYVSCAQEQAPGVAVARKADLCWATDNATISFGGQSGSLVKDSTTGVWKLEGDDNSRIEKLVGTAQGCKSNGTYNTECWRLTTTDGTQYWFGLNQLPGWTSGKTTTASAWTVPVFGNDKGDPCKASTFAKSSCKQGWRWNLDYIVDVNGNAQALYYKAETNKYRLNNTTATSYVRGGQLVRVDYGLKSSTVYQANAATGRIVFSYDVKGRCNRANLKSCSNVALGGAVKTPATPSVYPDVPWDLNCTSGTCTGKTSPSFWTSARLASITTQTFTASAYKNVDKFTLTHSFPDPGDGQAAALWLDKIQRVAKPGATNEIVEGATTFQKVALQNRVWVVDGLAPLDKFRISSVYLPTGARIAVNYSAQECTKAMAQSILDAPWNNNKRCFPSWWTPELDIVVPARKDLFHKYVVTSTNVDPHTGGGGSRPIRTNYVYTGTPGWRYVDDRLIPRDRRTWSEYAGYDTVEVRVGDPATPAAQQTTQYTFYRGMNGDRLNASGGSKSITVTGTSIPDDRWLGGLTRSEKTLKGVGGAVLSTTTTTPWSSGITSNDGLKQARVVGVSQQDVTVPLSTSGTRTTSTINTMDARGFVTQVSQQGGSGERNTCTKTSYAADNTTKWIIGLPSTVTEYDVACSGVATAPIPASVLSHKQMAYDSLGVGVAPTKGLLTTASEATGFSGTTLGSATMIASHTYTYDAMGRTTKDTDSASHAVSTAYTPSASAAAGSGPLASTTVTTALGSTKTTVDAYRGQPVTTVDENTKTTSTEYDALGRLTKVWKTDRPKGSNPSSPSIAYAYGVFTTKPSYIKETTLAGSGTVSTYTLVDGLGRTVQSQSPVVGGGALVTDAEYDSAGRQSATNDGYWAPSVTPGSTLFVPATINQISSRTETQYDGAGRAVVSLLRSFGTEVRRTTTTYRGSDRTDVKPPSGGIPTSTYTDAWGQTTKTTQWTGDIDGAGKVSLRYEYNGRGQMTRMLDDANNEWLWQYSLQGFTTSSTDPDAGTTTSTYDTLGNVVTTTDASGTTLAYTYDAMNRKTTERSGSVTGTTLASWTYDSLAKGQLTSSTRFVDGLEYKTAVTGYDNGYRPTGSTVTIPAGAPAFAGTTYTTNLYYNADGSLLAKSVPAAGGLPQEDLVATYDGFRRQTGLSGASSYVAGVSYFPTGEVGQIVRPGKVWSALTFSYDEATHQLKSLDETTRRNQTEFTQEALREYTRNDAGIITRASTTSPGGIATDVQCFTYNGLQALTDAWTPASGDCSTGSSATRGGPAPYRASYAVDAVTGNRTASTVWVGSTSTSSTYSYPAAGAARPHAVTQVSATTGSGSPVVTSYAHDANGAMTTRGSQTLTYDQSGRVSTVVSGGATEKSLYAADGSLLMRWGGADGASLYLGETILKSKAGVTTGVRSYTVAGVTVAERVSGTGGGLWWLSPDPVGTVGMQINASTGAVTRRWMDPYGNNRGTAVSWSSEMGYLNAPRSDTGLTQLGAREYDAGLGRFISMDPMLDTGDPRHANAYAYSYNSPVSYSDPTGLIGKSTSIDSVGHVGSRAMREVAALLTPVPLSGYVPR